MARLMCDAVFVVAPFMVEILLIFLPFATGPGWSPQKYEPIAYVFVLTCVLSRDEAAAGVVSDPSASTYPTRLRLAPAAEGHPLGVPAGAPFGWTERTWESVILREGTTEKKKVAPTLGLPSVLPELRSVASPLLVLTLGLDPDGPDEAQQFAVPGRETDK